MKKLITPLLVFAALVGGFLSARQLDAQVTYSPARGDTLRGTVDPTAGGGLSCGPGGACAEGTLYVRTGGTDQLWQKTGSGATAWTQIALSGGSASFSSVTATGDITTSAGNLVATLGDCNAGDDLLAGDDLVVTDDAVITDAITATNGNITASAGNLVATIGDVSVGDDVLASDAAVITGRTTSAGFTSSIAGTGSLPSYNWNVGGDTDNGLYYSGAANRWELAAGGADVWSVRTALAHAYVPFSAASTANITGTTTITNATVSQYIEFTETTAPSGATDKARVYAVIDGGSKTDLASIFQSGATQIFAQEP